MEYGWIERLRGIDRWPFVLATVTSVEQISEGGRGGAWRKVFFSYRCGSKDFVGKLSVDSNSSVYELGMNDTFDIQYNPAKPSQYFCEEAQSLFATVHRFMVAVVLLFLLFAVLGHVLHW